MPGLPIEPDVISQTETLSETSPGALDSLVDNEATLNFGEPISDDGGYRIEEADIEQLNVELHEIEPPDEDQMEDSDTPAVAVTGPDSELEGEDEENGDDDDDTEENSVNTEQGLTNETDCQVNGGTEGGVSIEDVMDRLKVDGGDSAGDSDARSEGQRSSGEVFHDALDSNESEDQQTELRNDPGGTGSEKTDSSEKDSNIVDKSKEKPPDTNEGTSVDNNTDQQSSIEELENGIKSNNNIEKACDTVQSESCEDNVTDTTVKSLNETPSEQV